MCVCVAGRGGGGGRGCCSTHSSDHPFKLASTSYRLIRTNHYGPRLSQLHPHFLYNWWGKPENKIMEYLGMRLDFH